jgi:hypothetical protein
MKIQVITGCALGALALAACGSARISAARPVTVSGQMAVQEDCLQASQDYPDITAGTQVVLTNPSGKVLDASALGGGTDAPGGSGGVGQCNYPFTVRMIPGQPRYGITIGQNRGTVWFTPANMKNGPVLSLG